MKCNDRKKHNRIWLVAALVILLVFSLKGLQDVSAPIIALEQEARCGMEEHIHTGQCPAVCLVPAHTHGKNCYLVLLEDNDINALLSHVDYEQSNNLETLINTALDTALPQPKQEQVPMVDAEEPNLAVLDIAELNETMARESKPTGIVFNEHLYLASALQSGPTDITLPTAVDPGLTGITNSGISTLSVGDTPQTNSQKANFYVYLDGSWVCIGTQNFSSYRSGQSYGARMSTTILVYFVNNQLGTNLTYTDFSLKYATSAAAATWNDGQINSTYAIFGTGYGRQSTARQAKYVRIVDGNGDPLPFFTVTFVDTNGNTTSQYVQGGHTVTLPATGDYIWSDGTANYVAGQTVEINSTKTFTAREDTNQIRIAYNVNFPTVSGVTVATKPTLYGTADTSLTDTVADGDSTVIRNVSQQEVMGKVDGNSTNLSRIIRFSGWKISGTETILSANSTLTWTDLQNYADGSRLVLEGVWDSRYSQTASFYVRYDSVAVDTDGNMTSQDSNLYTPELFATHVGGEDCATLDYNTLNAKYYIADTSADNSFGADQAIRALYGEQPGIWLQSFPEDDYIFEHLKNYAQYLQVDGEPVNVNDLNANTYTIRWYVFKSQYDAWHIDGRLVKKEGLMHVAKSFAGNKEAIGQAKADFYIEAYNETFTNRYILTLNEVADPTSHEAYTPGAKFTAPSSYDAATDRYLWELTDVVYGEGWTITEYPTPLGAAFSTHAEYRVVDIFNLQNKTGVGTTVDISGVTYATDAGTPEVLRTEFANIYHTSDSIIIKKEDARTGSALGGATFRILQNDAPLRFRYDPVTGRYIYDPISGDTTELSGSATGYYEIVITGFSYDNGNITVQEMEPPPGYTPVENVILGYLEGTQTVGILSQSPMAQYYDGLLMVKNTTEATSVTVTKQWLCPQSDWADVTVQLLANGSLVSYLVPGVEPEMTLSSANGYTATWDDLPIYANGSQIVWSVREVKIGSEHCKTDYTFANWIVSYSDPVYTTDENGVVTNTAFTVENDTRRTLLRLTKTNSGGGLRLADATFTLQHMLPDGTGGYTADPNFAVRIMTTGSEGTLTFDNLLYGRYQLTEITAPGGYVLLADPIYLTITESGEVLVDAHAYAQAGTAAYSIVVRNQPQLPLPATGGMGTIPLSIPGWLLTLGAIGALTLPYKKRRRGERSDE